MILIEESKLPFDPEDGRFEEWRAQIDAKMRKLRFPLRPFRLHDPKLGLKVACFPFTLFFWLVDLFAWMTYRYVICCLPLVWLAELPRAIVVGTTTAIGNTTERISNVFFPKPKVGPAELGAIVDSDGKVIGRLYPMRPLTLVLHFFKMIIFFFVFFFIVYIIWLFVRWLVGLEATIHAAYVKDTTFIVAT